uniref:Uncharacterized protein n=1 Tax=Anguilla anguilla TaxID=7936 RepID=A0A0E9TSE3_ANGAN
MDVHFHIFNLPKNLQTQFLMMASTVAKRKNSETLQRRVKGVVEKIWQREQTFSVTVDF